MANTETSTTEATQNVQLEGGTYEIIRKRLEAQAKTLQARLNKLNNSRKDVFGNIETKLIANNRISTENNCTPRDMIAVGKRFIFAYNVQVRLRQIQVKDVFSVFHYDTSDHAFQEEDLSLIQNKQFEQEFAEMYKFYPETVFLKFAIIDAHLYMVFQTGKKITDIQAFKWIITGEKLTYSDSRSKHEFQYPSQHEFQWKTAKRELFREGSHPHISILDRVFVETVGGDLTIKVEDNTESGEGIYAEPVDKEQRLDQAEFYYADLGNLILLKIKPYQEKDYRYLVFNEKLQQVQRIDKIEEACILLPDNQGLIFSNGYYLQSGEYKTFDNELENMIFEKHVQASNGEDHLYVFHNDIAGIYILLPYNLIEQKVENPIICNGFSLFEAGEMAYFKSEAKASKTHLIQIWQTPFTSPDFMPEVAEDNFLFKVGNKDLVRGMADINELINLLYKEEVYETLYLELVKKSQNILDAHYWINNKETFLLNEPVVEIRDSASSAIDEFEKVVRVKQNTQEQINTVSEKVSEIVRKIKRASFNKIDQFVETLAQLRTLRGEIISLKDLRYTDLKLVESFEAQIEEETQKVSDRTIRFLLEPKALEFYTQKIAAQETEIEQSEKVSELTKIEEEVEQTASQLELLIDIVSNLKIDDATQTTQIIDNISSIFAVLNQVKSRAKAKKKDLRSVEAVAEFNAQIKLINQGVINYLDVADTPTKADEYLTKLMIQIEELEGKFVDFDEFIGQIAEKREEIYNAFESKKLALVEARNKRATALQNAADRILKGIKNRISGFKDVNEINGYFAGDLMIDKVRDIIEKLVDLEDTVKSDEIQSRLKSIKEDAVRQLKDRQEMFVEGENVIKFGRHAFSVNVQNLDLTIVQKEGEMFYHLTGTNFFEKIEDKDFNATKEVWTQSLISENDKVYRAEYLAFSLYQKITAPNPKGESDSIPTITDFLSKGENKKPNSPLGQGASLLTFVQKQSSIRYNEGYTKGVHDSDASKILAQLLDLHQNIDLLRYPTLVRACASYFWQTYLDKSEKELLYNRLKGIGIILQVFPHSKDFGDVVEDLQEKVQHFLNETELFPVDIAKLTGEYLFYELTRSDEFIISQEAGDIFEQFNKYLKKNHHTKTYQETLDKLTETPQEQYEMLKTWLTAFVNQHNLDADLKLSEDYIEESCTLLFYDNFDAKRIVKASIRVDIEGMLGSHSVIQDKKYHLNYNGFMFKLNHFAEHTVPLYQKFTQLKKDLTEKTREALRLSEFQPRVLSSFVRNKLINEVYLPLIGDNLAKQIGVVGENKRTDLMGMLLLISPPGYGKTTLMEYIASRLGIIFMKINGPAIGHQVTSLDPSEAPNASAREEVNKLNLAFEMGDNVMVYVDDIQHCNPEFLQKFISLTDGQRKIEGVYKGKTKTYDLRGRKVVVVMAGNPYTESGEKFQIPDMLSNRADTYNLGDIIGDSANAFELSYIENSLTSNPVLNKLATRSQKDIYTLIRLAETDNREGLDFEGNYSSEELNEYVAVLKKMLVVRDYILKNNLEYIRSAAQSDEFRTEPAFKLQGSYRDMNKISEKIVPIMNDKELHTLVFSHYENEAQTLTSGAESNLLKFKELNTLLTEEDRKRWEEIKATFQKNNQFKGLGSDEHMGQVLLQLANFTEGLEGIKEVIASRKG